MAISKKRISDEINGLNSSLKVIDASTPKNDYSERKKFMQKYNKGEHYNPQYVYKKKSRNLEEIKNRLLKLKEEIDDKHYKALIRKILLKVDFIQNIGNDEKMILTNGSPDPDMVELAKQTIKKKKGRVQKRMISAKDAKTAFVEYLQSYGIRDWKVSIKKKMFAKANVEPIIKTISIKDRKYSFHEINNLISHEIAVHALRAHNGYKLKNSLLAMGTADYLKTEEGLAIMMEHLTGNYNEQRIKFFAARIIATDMALSKSFYEIFNTLHKKYNLSKSNAYIITKRVKRSMSDTSKPGGYVKDHVYFEGFHMIKEFMQKGGDIRPLFAGKVSLRDIGFAKKCIKNKKIIIPRAVIAHYQNRSKQTTLF